jgi:hypothetical protein
VGESVDNFGSGMRGVRVNRNVGLSCTTIHRPLVLPFIIEFFARIVAFQFCSRGECTGCASRPPISSGTRGGSRRCRSRAGSRTFADAGGRFIAISRGTLDELQTDLFQDRAVLGVVPALVMLWHTMQYSLVSLHAFRHLLIWVPKEHLVRAS